MRFLNRKWAEGAYDEFSTDLYWQVYLRHLESITPDLPAGARALAATSMGKNFVGLQVAATRLDAGAGAFHLVLKLETIEGPAWLEIEYRGVDPEAIDEHALDDVDYLLTDEIDLAPNELFEHRFLLSPEGEFAIRFRDLELKLRHGEE